MEVVWKAILCWVDLEGRLVEDGRELKAVE
jgi:hypothetical protein